MYEYYNKQSYVEQCTVLQ